jgi:nitronate monooxygenase
LEPIMPIKTRLTQRFQLKHPIVSAPMAFAAGGGLAGAVAAAGGLGLIGGAYGDGDWIATEFQAAGNQSVGCGFITWSLRTAPHLLTAVLERRPKAVFLSFDDPEPFAAEVRSAGIPLFCQVQTLAAAGRAIDVGADVIVAQGAEAGGHGEKRATMTLVPEVADLIAARSPETLLCAAGGIADGRGLAAALALGADGVVIGSRFWASAEAKVHPRMHQAAIAATGDDTIRSSVMDIARRLDWPDAYTARVLKNPFTERWHGREADLIANAAVEAARWRAAWADGDTEVANTFVGEATGLIRDIQPAALIIASIAAEAEAVLRRSAGCLVAE